MSTNRKKKDKDNDNKEEDDESKEKKEENKPSPKKEKRKKKDKETPSKDNPSKDKDKDGKDGDEIKAPGSPPKPQSAGANTRDAAQRILALTQKGEWSPIDNILKQMERSIANALANGEEDVNKQPLLGVADPVSHH